jgi:hypothetical protein
MDPGPGQHSFFPVLVCDRDVNGVEVAEKRAMMRVQTQGRKEVGELDWIRTSRRDLRRGGEDVDYVSHFI